MGKERFKVIKGGGNKTPVPKYRFKRGFVTNTRLMGVIGIKLFWETEDKMEYVQLFHLDFEEYGIDGFESILNGSRRDIDTKAAKMMGGLGGKFQRISKREALYLLKKAYMINLKNGEDLPQPFEEYEFLLRINVNFKQDEVTKLWKKMCVDIESDIHLINYYVMRAMGTDEDGQKYLGLGRKAYDYRPTSRPSTLIKNTVEFSHENNQINYYNVKSVVDLDNGYQLVISEIGVKDTEEGLKVVYAEAKNKLKITTIEAVFQLKRTEYILIYSISDFVELLTVFDNLKPGAMQNMHEAGFLYTEFNPDNDHVKEPVYYLNGDIYAVYYVTTGSQLAVSTFSKENLKKLKAYLGRSQFKKLLEFEGEFKADGPLLYEFVQSGYEDFFNFLNNEEE